MSALRNSLIKNLRSYGPAAKGIMYVVRNENNFRYHLFGLLVASGAGWALNISPYEWLFVIGITGLILSAEAFNTALEHLADHVTQDHHDTIGRVKDVSAGAVLLASVAATAGACVIYIPKILSFIS